MMTRRKASRIVELAKQAIYHEISTPCDMTSAHKALILVAGPSHELSMKGFMTVRKWIDRSIAGLETRSGDYPVMNTKNVAIIIMLSGLENIPRITELKEIRSQHKPRNTVSPEKMPIREMEEYKTESKPEVVPVSEKDEMIILPGRSSQGRENDDNNDNNNNRSPIPVSRRKMAPTREEVHFPDIFEPDAVTFISEPNTVAPSHESLKEPALPVREPSGPTRPSPAEAEETGHAVERTPPTRRRVLVAHDQIPVHSSVTHQIPVNNSSPVRKTMTEPVDRVDEHPNVKHTPDFTARTKETERQRIERELLRQRMVAISSPTGKKGSHPQKNLTVNSDEAKQRNLTVKSRSDQSIHK